MHRREFLIASSMGAAALSIASRANATPRDIPRAVVYETRYLAACEFAREHAEHGATVFGADGGMVQLWRGPLAEIASRGEARIAGLTTYSDFSIARACAREHGLRVLQESWNRETPVALVHWLIGT
jgi:hypothetical protein